MIYLIACVLAVADAGYIGNDHGYSQNSYVQSDGTVPSYVSSDSIPLHAGTDYFSRVQSPKGEEHVPVIKDGVPIDTPEVQRARAEHFALYAKAAAAAAKASAADDKRQYQPKYTQAYYRGSPNPDQDHYQSAGQHSPPGASPDYYSTGVEIQPSKAIYYNTLVESHSEPPQGHYRQKRGLEYSPGFSHGGQPQHIPVITKQGVPLDTPEVQTARLQHLLAHAEADSGHDQWKQGLDAYEYGHGGLTNHVIPQSNNIQYSVVHDNSYGWKSYKGPEHIPIIDKNGVPLETPEVQAAKEQHFLAHAKAKLQSNDWQGGTGIYGYAHQYQGSPGSSVSHGIHVTSDGVPEDTPEVKIARAKHLLAHAEEKAKHSPWSQSEIAYDENYLQH